jgi:undecaprenyl-diphosphatase
VPPGRNRALIGSFVAAATALLCFAWLANEVLRGATVRFDLWVRNSIHAWASPPLTEIMRGVTQLGSSVFVIAAGGVLIWRLAAAGRRRAGIALAVATIGGEALDQILKLVFHRPRPAPFFGLAQPSTFSFPSGHAVTACCFYGVLAAVAAARVQSAAGKAAIWALAAFAAAAIGFSRVYLGVHYPTDVMAGYAAAVIWITMVWAWYRLRPPAVRPSRGITEGRPTAS